MSTSIEQFVEERRALKLDREPGKHLTDLWTAEQFVKEFGPVYRHCKAIGDLVWDKYRWVRDDKAKAMQMLKRAIRKLYSRADKIEDEEARKNYIRHVIACEANSKLKAVLECSSSEPGICIGIEELDADPFALNTMSGTIDLRTGDLHPHNRTDFITKLAPVLYDKEAKCELWEKFLVRIFPKDEAMISFVQRAVGDALLGIVRNHVLHILYGTGANGKSVFIETACKLLGDYACVAPPKILLAKQHDEHPTEIADLRGRRFIGTIESGEGNRLDEPKVKQLCGGDRLKGRFMRRDFFEFDPSHTVFMATNHKPEIRGRDNGIWRRIKLWPFTVTIPKEEWDLQLKEKLELEYPGILAWAVRGCIDSQKDGLQEPPAVVNATSVYQTESDHLEMFIAERCQKDQENSNQPRKVGATDLYLAFKAWCGDDAMSQTRFGRAMVENGFEKGLEDGTRRVIYKGICLT